MTTLRQTLERKVHESRWFIRLIDQSNFTGSTISIHPVCKLPYLHLYSVPLGALTQVNKLKVSSLCEFGLVLAVRNVDTYNNHQQRHHGNQNGQDGYQCGCWGNHRLWWNCVCVYSVIFYIQVLLWVWCNLNVKGIMRGFYHWGGYTTVYTIDSVLS